MPNWRPGSILRGLLNRSGGRDSFASTPAVRAGIAASGQYPLLQWGVVDYSGAVAIGVIWDGPKSFKPYLATALFTQTVINPINWFFPKDSLAWVAPWPGPVTRPQKVVFSGINTGALRPIYKSNRSTALRPGLWYVYVAVDDSGGGEYLAKTPFGPKGANYLKLRVNSPPPPLT